MHRFPRLAPSAAGSALLVCALCAIGPLGVQSAGASADAAALPDTAVLANSAVLAASSCAVLPVSFGYTEFSPGNVTEAHGDSDGPTAFGGTSQLSNFAISEDAGLLPGTNVAFVAGGTVTGNGTTSVHLGNAYADASVNGVSFQDGGLNLVTQANLPVNFATAAAADNTLAAQLAALATSAGDLAGTSGTTLTLSATQTESDNQYVWSLSAGQLTGIKTISVTGVPAGGSVVVNIPDTGAVTIGVTNILLDGVSAAPSTGSGPTLANSTIFNFSGASSLGLTGAWAGTLFAPGATVTFSSGHVWGTVVGATLTGTNESTYGPLDSSLCLDLGTPGSPLPEGRPLALAAGAVVVLAGGFVIARRRRARRLTA